MATIGIAFDAFPEQGIYLGKKVRVCFSYDKSRTIDGTVVRDDIEDPGHTIIKLEDGRHVLATECQYQPL
ncbi:MAG: hypothetical protein JWN18_419 [Parcubacteria group bacterium]|nr:hypothetical protein [Parcubacteria group bacterium]